MTKLELYENLRECRNGLNTALEFFDTLNLNEWFKAHDLMWNLADELMEEGYEIDERDVE